MNQDQKPEAKKASTEKKTRATAPGKGTTSLPRARTTAARTSSDVPDFAKSAKKTTEASAADQKSAAPKRATAQRRTASQNRTGAQKHSTTQKSLSDTHHVNVTNSSDEALDEVLDAIVMPEADAAAAEAAPEAAPAPAPEAVEEQPKDFSKKPVSRRGRRAAQKMSELERIRKKSGFSEQDTDMMFELGYEDELGRVVGYEALKKLKQDHRERFGHPGKKHYRTSFGYWGEDVLNEDTRGTITAKYMHDRRFLILRTLLTALLTVLLFLLDVPRLLGSDFAHFDRSYPFLLPILSILLLCGSIAISWRQLNAGLRSFLKISPSPYSVAAFTAPVVILYDILALFLPTLTLRVNALMSGILLLLAICDILRILCEMRVFRLLSVNEEKTVLEITQPRKKKLRQGKKLVKIINDDVDEAFYRVQKAQYISGFFRRFNSTKSVATPLRIFIGALIALAFVLAFSLSLIMGSITVAFSVFISVMMLALPISGIFSFFYPLCRANRLLTYYNCALVGDETVEEYTASKTVIFSDADLYSAEKCTELSLKESDELRRDIKLSGILFRKIGGALDHIGRPPLLLDNDPSVAFVRISDCGLEAVIDNRYHVIAGDAEYLRKSGIRVPEESTDRILSRTENVSVMYIAVDGDLKLNYEIEYTVKPSFEALIASLAEIDTAVAIQSYDPNLNEAFLQVSRAENAIPIRVIKPGRFETDSLVKESDTGAVALGNISDIVYPLHAAKEVASTKQLLFRLQLLFSACGALAVTILCLISRLSVLSPLLIAGYHIACTAASLIVAHTRITKKSLRMRRQ